MSVSDPSDTHIAKALRAGRATSDYVRTFAAPALWADLKWGARSFMAMPSEGKVKLVAKTGGVTAVAVVAMVLLYEGPEERGISILTAEPIPPVDATIAVAEATPAPVEVETAEVETVEPAAVAAVEPTPTPDLVPLTTAEAPETIDQSTVEQTAAAVPETMPNPLKTAPAALDPTATAPATGKPQRTGFATYPTLNTWEAERTEDRELSALALAKVETSIADMSGGNFSTVMTINPALMAIQAKALQGRPMRAAVFERDGEQLGISVADIDIIDATVLIDACGEEERILIAGLPFVRMSTDDMPGFSAMLPRPNGDLIMIRATVPADQVQKLVTRERLAEIGARL